MEAIAKLRECDELIKRWSKSGIKPEQFTGERTKNILSKEELEGGYNAWVKKVMLCFHSIWLVVYSPFIVCKCSMALFM